MDELALEKQRERRKRNWNKTTKKYEKTKKGFLVRTYRNMLSRVTGILKKKAHLYKGKEILDKSVFYEWSLLCDDFNRIFDEWERQGYPLRIAPSIDRKDPSLGYSLDNMEWVEFHVNCSRTGRRASVRNLDNK